MVHCLFIRGGEPKSKKTAKIGHKNKFKKWDKEIQAVTEDKVYQATYSEEIEELEMPIISINVDDGTSITSKTEYKHSSVSLTNTNNKYCFSNVGAQIRGRGNSSWNQPKKPYRIKFDKKQSMFGSSYKAKNWTLIANYSDKSLLRNYIAYELSKQIGGLIFSSIHIPVDLYINNEYLGVYLLCDQIEVGKGRVDIDESVDSKFGNNGYLIELDGRAPQEGILDTDYFVASDNRNYTIKSPDTSSSEYLEAKDIEINYIKNYFNQCCSTIKNGSWSDVNNLININSFVSAYIVEELFMNPDVGFASVFYYKDKNGKLFHGPLWDFDISAGNSNYGPGTKESCPFDAKLCAATANPLFKYLCNRKEFKCLILEKLNAFKDDFQSVINLLNVNDQDGIYLNYKESLNRNFKKWEIMGKYIWPEPEDVYAISTVKGQISFLKQWLEGRYLYLISVFSQ